MRITENNPLNPPCQGEVTNNGFTLVELIVVVTILAILATIGFVSYSSYLIGVRDTNRIAQMTSLSDGLNLYSTTNDLPIPEDNVEVSVNGNLIAYQGYAGVNILETINFDKGGLDPKDNSYFSYYLTRDRKLFQMMGFLEESADLTTSINKSKLPPQVSTLADAGADPMIEGEFSLLNSAHAVNFQDRIPTVSGKKLGILTDLENTPVQDLGTDVDITSTTTEFKAFLTNKEILTNTELTQINPIQSCKRIKQAGGGAKTGRHIINPTGVADADFKVYCDMETDGGGWTLVGVSNGNYPSATFLDGVTGTAPKNIRPGYEYSIDASEIIFSEVAMGLDGDNEKYFGFLTNDQFENDRAFETTSSGSETCVIIDGYYTKNNGGTKYWKLHYGYEETLITSRRDHASGGIDLGTSVSSCDSSGNSIAVYRGSSAFGIAAGNGNSAQSTWTNLASTTLAPTAAGLSQSDYPELGIDRDVWIMVR